MKRAFLIILLNIGILIFPLEDAALWKLMASMLITFYLITKPQDDLAINEDYIFHIQESVISKFSRIDKYRLPDLTSIRCGGIHSDKWELIDFFNGSGNNGGYSNTVEMTFRNGSSKSLDLAISRDKLDEIVELAYKLKKEHA